MKVRIRLPTTTPEMKLPRGVASARSRPVIKVGRHTLNSTLLTAIFHHGIECSCGTGEVENSFDSMIDACLSMVLGEGSAGQGANLAVSRHPVCRLRGIALVLKEMS